MVILISREQLKFGKSRRQLTTGNIAHGKCKSGKTVCRLLSVSKSAMKSMTQSTSRPRSWKGLFQNIYALKKWFSQNRIFSRMKSIFKKMPPGNPRNRIRDFLWATLLVVKGFPKFNSWSNAAHPRKVSKKVTALRVSQLDRSWLKLEALRNMRWKFLTPLTFHAPSGRSKDS